MKKNLNYFMVILLYFCATINLHAQNGVSNSPLTPPSATLPYSCDFSDPTENQNWIISNGTAVNQWVIGTPSNVQSPIVNQALYISNDAGVTNAYTMGSISTVVASRIIEFTGASEYILNLDLFIGGESSYDYVRVFITDVDSNYTGTAGTPYYGATSYTANTQLLYSYNNLATYFNGYNGSSVVAASYPKQLIIPNQGPAGTLKKLVIVWRNDGSGGTQPPACIDNISLIESTCPRPTALLATNISFNSLDLSWTEPASATNWVIEYGPVGFAHGSGTTVNVQNTSNYTVSGLNSGAQYQFYVQSDCGSTNLSAWSVPITITTIPLSGTPFNEGFISNSPFGFNTSGWNIGIARGVMGNPGNNIFKNLYASASTGTFTTTNIGPIENGMQLTYDFIFAEYDSPYAPPALASGKFYLSISTDLGVTYSIIDSVENNGIAGYQPKLIDLSAYATQYVKFKVDASWITGDFDLAFDNFRVGLPIVCQKPTLLSSSNITLNSFDIHWHENGSATNWNIEYGPVGFTQGTGTLVTASVDTMLTISNLSNSTSYQVIVQADCGSGTVSDWSDPIIIATIPLSDVPYNQTFNTTTTPLGYNTSGWIIGTTTAVTGNPLNNIYKNLYSSSPTGSFYTTNIGPVTAGMSLSFDYKHAYYSAPYASPAAGTGKFFVSISNDFGLTYTIIDSIENNGIDGYQMKLYDLSAFSGNIIKVKFDAQWISGDYYLAFDNINVDITPVCPKPTALFASNLTSSSVDLNWTENGTATNWNIEYGPTGFTLGTGTLIQNVTSFPYNVGSLTDNTVYQFYIQAACSASDLSVWSNVASFRTLCAPNSTLPLTESFDTYGTGSTIFPTCWLKNSNVVNNPNISTTNSTAPGSLYFDASSVNKYSIAISPLFDASIPLNTLKADFKLRVGGLDDTLYVGVMTNPSDTNSFELINTFVGTATYTWQDREVYFDNYTGTAQYIAFKTKYGATSSTIYIDNLVINTIPSCPRPNTLAASLITPNSAQLTWIENGTATEWQIEYGPVGFTIGTGTILASTNNPFDLINLTQNTQYQVYVYANCGAGLLSEPSLPITFTTQGLATVPYLEPFTTTTTPAGYNIGWSIGSVRGVTGNPGNNIYKNLYASTATSSFTTTNIGPVASNMVLSFDYKFSDYSTPYNPSVVGSGNFIVAISTDWGNTFTNVDTVDNSTLPGYLIYNFDLAAFVGQTIKIKITGNRFLGDFDLGIDNIKVDLPVLCPKPTALIASNTTQTTADLSWTENGSSTSWNIEFGPVGFTQGTGTLINATTNPISMNSLQSGICYDFYVQADCGSGSLSEWSLKGSFCTSQIPENVPFTINFETPSNFQFANNPSGNVWVIDTAVNNTTPGQNAMYISNNNGVTNSYDDATSAVVWAYRDIYFTPSTTDYILSFDWKGMGETSYDYLNVYMGAPAQPTPATSSAISIPAGATAIETFIGMESTWQTASDTLSAATYSGLTKRIYFCWRNDGSDGDQPAIAVDNISITPLTISVCNTPTNLHAVNTTSNAITIAWTPAGTESAWELDYKLSSASTWTTTIVNNTPQTAISSLTETTSYDFRVRAICSATDMSSYTSTIVVVTLTTPCAQPTNLQVPVATITDQSALVTWTPGGSETSWNIEYKLVSASNWTSATVSQNSYSLQGLQPNAIYEVRVKAICTSNNSDFTATVQFTTLNTTVVNYIIVATATGNGTITPAGNVTVVAGNNQTFTFSPNTGNVVTSLTVNGSVVANPGTTYTFTNVQADQTINVQFGVGISENQWANLVSIYPNPTSDIMEISINLTNLTVLNAAIYDMYGKVVNHISIHENLTQISVNHLSSGVYFLQINTDKGIITKKFIKK